MVSEEDYRRLALSFPEATEESHMNHPDFRVGNKIFATLFRGNGTLLLTPAQQQQVIKANPRVFSPATGGWGRKGSTTVHLKFATEAIVRMAMTIAWRNKAFKKLGERLDSD